MRCRVCGCRITAEEKFKYIKSTGETRRYVYYHCTRKRKDYKCPQNEHLEERELEKQMIEKLGIYAILPNFRDWGLKALNDRHLIESNDRTSIYEMQHRAITQAQGQLDNIDDMVSRGAMAEDRYLKKSATLKAKIEKLEGELQQTQLRAKDWQSTFEKTLFTCATAAERFNKGDYRMRREVLLEIGYNPTLQDKILYFEPEDWFQPIADRYPEVEAEYQKVITTNYASTNEKTAALATIYSKWQGHEELNLDLRFWRPP